MVLDEFLVVALPPFAEECAQLVVSIRDRLRSWSSRARGRRGLSERELGRLLYCVAEVRRLHGPIGGNSLERVKKGEEGPGLAESGRVVVTGSKTV